MSLISNFLISFVLIGIVGQNSPFDFNRSIQTNSPQDKIRLETFINKNESNLSAEEKERLKIIKTKLEKSEGLNQQEVDFFRECQLKIMRTKLGDSLYDEYCKLIQKRESNAEFTQPERMRLLEIEKILNN